MKKFISLLLALIMLSLTAFATEDYRLIMREGDDYIPFAEGQQFVRYTPWLRGMHLMSATELESGAHGGEAAQQIRCLDISPVDPNLVIFGSDTSGVWITKNDGELWYNTNRNIVRGDISDVMCHPTDKNIMFAYPIGTMAGVAASGIYRSTDMGRSWTRVFTDYVSSSQTDKLFGYDNNGNIYVVTGQGVIKSTDDGENWTLLLTASEEVNDSSNRVRATSLSVSADGKTIIACYAQNGFSLNGINISYDGGATWEKKYISDTEINWNTYSFVIDPKNESRYLAGVYNPDTATYEAYISSDKGENWTKFKSSSSSYNMVRTAGPIVRLRMTEDKLYAAYDHCDRNFRYLAYSELDNAVNTTAWKTFEFGALGVGTGTYRGSVNMYFSQGVDIQGDTMWLCTAGPQKYTFSTDTWERRSSGYSGASIEHFNMDENGRLIMSCVDSNIVISDGNYTSAGAPTFKRYNSNGSTIATMTLTDKHDKEGDRIICWYGNSNTDKSVVGIIVTPDLGATYEDYIDGEYAPRITDPKLYGTKILEYDDTDEYTIYASCGTSYDNGVTWIANDYHLLDISGSKMLAWDIYGDSPTYDVLYSTDKGKNWTRVTSMGPYGDNHFTAYLDATDSANIWYLSTYDFGKINLSTGKKTSYKPGTPYYGYGGIAQNPKDSDHILLWLKGIFSGYCPSLYESYDHGESWHVVPGIYGRRTVNTVKFSTTTNEVFIGSHSGTMIYEYDKFNYYQALRLKNGNEEILTTVDFENGMIQAPDEVFEAPLHKHFAGWRYNDRVYKPGEEITITK